MSLQLIRAGMAFVPQDQQPQMFTAAVRGLSTEADNFYSRLGETQQNMLSEMILRDEQFGGAIERMIASGSGMGADAGAIPSGVMNTMITEAYNDPHFRGQIAANLHDPEGLLAAVRTEARADPAFASTLVDAQLGAMQDTLAGRQEGPRTPAEAAPAATPPAAANGDQNFFQQLMANPQIQGMMTGMMNMLMASPLGVMVNMMFEAFLGRSLTSLLGSSELISASGGPDNNGEMMTQMLDPAQTIHATGEGPTETMTVGELGAEHRPDQQVAGQQPGHDRNMAPGMNPVA